MSISLEYVWQVGCHIQNILNIVLFQRFEILAVGSVAEEEASHDLDRLDVDRLGEIVRCTFAVGRLGAAAAGRVRERNRYAERPKERAGEENMLMI